MTTYIIKRLLLMIPTLIGITIVTFGIMKLAPGDPAAFKLQAAHGMMKGEQLAEEIIAETRKLYGLDKPLWEQYARWVWRIARLNLGESFKDHRPVWDKIREALPITLLLNVLTILIIYTISIPLGVISALQPRGFADQLITVALFVLYSLPAFWVATLLIVFLAGGDYLNWFPLGGILSYGAEGLPWWNGIANVAWHLVLPVVCLTYGGFAFLARFARASMLEVIRQDYIRTARAKGLAEWRVLAQHALRNAMIPLVTLMGTLLPALLGGSVIIEQIFAIPGMGRLGFEAVLSRDYPTIMAIATIDAVLTLISLLLSDLLYVWVDPRITFEGSA